MAMQKESIVSIVQAETSVYDDIDFSQMLQHSTANLEAAGIQIPSGGTVFIKPNVVAGLPARQSITTEPRLVAALISLLKQRGVRKIYVGDSSAGYCSSKQNFESTGMAAAVTAAGAELVNIDAESETTLLELPHSDMLQHVRVARKALEADCLINFGKLKTHRIGNSLTCTVKNWVGFLPQDIRLKYHQTRLPKLIAELHRALPAHLSFADAIIVGEADGPDLSKPRYLGVLLSAKDPVALDSIAAELVGINRSDLLFAWTAYLDGIGEIKRNHIKVIGPDIRDLAIQVEKPVPVLYNRFPCNIVLGGMCDGCFAWFMGPALFWERDAVWQKINENCGRPTFMMGFNAQDFKFEEHLKQGPYFVIGDCTPEKYRDDPRTVYIAGCCPGPAIPELILKHCGITEAEG
jgi:uncharacterized protein (DUF362 family)